MPGCEDRPTEPPAGPVGTHEHRTDVCGLLGRVEQAIVILLIVGADVETSPPTPPSTGHDLASNIMDEVGTVRDKHRVDMSDIDSRAGGLPLVVVLGKQLQYRRPHDIGHRVDIS